jgi:hypothetical protein
VPAKPSRRTRTAPVIEDVLSVKTEREPVRSPVDGVPSLVSGERFGVSSGRRASAARVIAAGLICFGLWTLFDANQLYHNALSSPFGTRRTVAIEILRPLATAMNAVGISGPVNAADGALGRNGPATDSTLPPLPPPPAFQGRRAPNNANGWGVAPAPHSRGGEGPPTAQLLWPPPIPQPTKADPLVILDIGDSIGVDLGFGLGDVFANDPYVRVLQKGHIDTGLARPDAYNWPAVLEADLRQYHPGVVVMMIGANDDQALSVPGGSSVAVGTAEWNRAYHDRIDLVMAEATAAGLGCDADVRDEGEPDVSTAGGVHVGRHLLLVVEPSVRARREVRAVQEDRRRHPSDPLQRRRTPRSERVGPSCERTAHADAQRLARQPSRRTTHQSPVAASKVP